jgi:hypothetical protein
MTPKEALKELNKCDKLKCQGCHMNIRVLHGFDCAARFCSLDTWGEKLLHICRIQSNFPVEVAIGEVIYQHKHHKEDCTACPFWDEKFGKCEIKRFQNRQTILRVMRCEESV